MLSWFKDSHFSIFLATAIFWAGVTYYKIGDYAEAQDKLQIIVDQDQETITILKENDKHIDQQLAEIRVALDSLNAFLRDK